jgi:DNA-binding NtrC family response regulator
MNILLIEGDAHRRVIVAKHLADASHRVTIASSICEAQEILRFVRYGAAAPQAVIAAEKLLRREGSAFREELAARFPNTNWIPLRSDLDPDWLTVWLRNLAVRGRKSMAKHANSLNILLIEPDDVSREAMTKHLASRGDRVSACRSLEEASRFLSNPSCDRRSPHAIVSPVVVEGADGIGFYLSVRRRLPKIRWIVTPAQPSAPQVRPPSSAKVALTAVKSLGRARRSMVATVRSSSSR